MKPIYLADIASGLVALPSGRWDVRDDPANPLPRVITRVFWDKGLNRKGRWLRWEWESEFEGRFDCGYSGIHDSSPKAELVALRPPGCTFRPLHDCRTGSVSLDNSHQSDDPHRRRILRRGPGQYAGIEWAELPGDTSEEETAEYCRRRGWQFIHGSAGHICGDVPLIKRSRTRTLVRWRWTRDC